MNKETIDITSDKIDLFSFFTLADQLPKKDTILDRKIISQAEFLQKYDIPLPDKLHQYWKDVGNVQFFANTTTYEHGPYTLVAALFLPQGKEGIDFNLYEFLDAFVFKSNLGKQFEINKFYLKNCFRIFAQFQGTIDGCYFVETHYFDALGRIDSYRYTANVDAKVFYSAFIEMLIGKKSDLNQHLGIEEKLTTKPDFNILEKTDLMELLDTLDFSKLESNRNSPLSLTADVYIEKFNIPIPERLIEITNTFGAIRYHPEKPNFYRKKGLLVNSLLFAPEGYGLWDLRLYHYLEQIVYDKNVLGYDYYKHKEYLSLCYRVFGELHESFNGYNYQEIFYFDAFGEINSFRFLNEPDTSAFVDFVKQLNLKKDKYSDFMVLAKKRETEKETNQSKLIAEKSANKEKRETKEEYLSKYGLEEISYAEAIKRLGVDSLFNKDTGILIKDDEEHDDVFEHYSSDQIFMEEELEELSIFFADHDIEIQGNFSIPNQYDHKDILVVKGNLTIHGHMNLNYYVTGNVQLDSVEIGGLQTCGDTEQILYLQTHYGRDDEVVHTSMHKKITAPLFISWFYDLDCYEFSPGTTIIAMYEWSSLKQYKTNNTILRWHDSVFAMKDAASYHVDHENYDAPVWSTDNILKLLKSGESIYREGFSVDCLKFCDDGWNLWEDKQYEMAFLHYRKATEISPAYFPAWNSCARLLVDADAYTQAIPYLQKALEAAPEKVPYAKGYAIKHLIFCFIRLGKIDEAIQLINQDAIPLKHDLKFIYRLSGEAHIIKGNYEKALDDLRQAFNKHNNYGFPVLWLTGLAMHQLGNKPEAQQWLEKARAKEADCLDYTQAKDLAFYNGQDKNVDWESKCIATGKMDARDQAYWNQQFTEDRSISKVPEEFITKDMINFLMTEKNNRNESYFNWSTFHYIPKRLITREIAIKAFDFNQELDRKELEKIPTEFLDKGFFLEARKYPFYFIPRHLIDYDICFDAVKKSHANILKIPAEYKDENMLVAAVCGGALGKYTKINLPNRFRSPEIILRAVGLSFHALKNIPAHYISQSVFKHAEKLYENNSEWSVLLREHMPWKDRNKDTLKRVWASFWDESFILNAVNRGNNIAYLSPEYITLDIANAIANSAPYHLELIPESLLTEEMCVIACSRSDGDAIKFIPLQLRTHAVCESALYRDRSHLKYVPLNVKTEEFCLRFYDNSLDNITAIPYQYYPSIITRLLALDEDKKDLHDCYCLLYRGIGYFYCKDYEKAIADFSRLQEIEIEEDDQSYLSAQSFYFLGWIAYDMEEFTQAEIYYKAAQDLYQQLNIAQEDILDKPYNTAALPNTETASNTINTDHIDFTLNNIYEWINSGFHIDALHEIANLEKKLEESLYDDMSYWAVVWNCKRFALYEAGQKEQAYQVCRDAIEQLSKVETWAYIRLHNNIRATLRAMYNMLAYHQMENAQSLADLKVGLSLINKAFSTISPTEDKSDLENYYETKAELLLKAVAYDGSYQAEVDKVLCMIESMANKKLLSEDFSKKISDLNLANTAMNI